MDSQSQLSQSSVLSSTSTIPPGIIDNTDDDFVKEINEVNDLYFGNLSDSNSTCDVNDSDLEIGNESDICDDDDESDKENENEDSMINIPLEISAVDRFDKEKIEKFRLQTCGCSRLYGKPCSDVVEFSSVLEYRNHCLEISNDELDLIIKVQLFHHRKNDASTTAKKHKSKERERPRQEYFFCGRHVCRETFAFCHGVCRKKVDTIARSLDNEGLVPRTHGNKGKSPKHSLTVNDMQLVKEFLTTYGNKYGLPLPGRLPNYKESRAVILPSDKSKADIHQDYLVAAGELNLRKICLSEFKKLWIDMCPYLLISRKIFHQTSDLVTRHEFDVLISAYMRGGSKLLGNIIGEKDGIFYFYEPLWKLTPYGVFIGRNECSLVTNKCSNSSITDIARQILKEIYDCKLTTFGRYIYPWLHIKYGGSAWNSILNCNTSVYSCLLKLERKCRSSSARTAKVIRTSLDHVMHVLNNHSRVKVVHMYRDPRAIIYSRMTSMPHIFTNITTSSASLCKKILDDSDKIKLIIQKFPQMILKIYYEDLVENFDKTVKKIYRFLNFEFTSVDDKRILPMKCNKCVNKKAQKENIWNTVRADSFQASVKWRNVITMDTVKQIDVLCSDAYLATGYRKVNSLDEIRDTKIKLLQKPYHKKPSFS